MSSGTSSSAIPKRREFLTVAEELSVLNAPTIAMLRDQSASQGIPPIQLALQKALITPTQLDIIETMCRPFEIVPGYEVRGVIGQGGMGVVFRARQLSLDRDVAIKLVPLHQLSGDVAVKRFEVEAQVLARLAHPHIVTAFDFGKHEGRLYFVMEVVEGEDADHFIRRNGCFDESTAWHILRQAASGLSHAQQAGVVHRDVKPANILLLKPPAGYPLPAGVPMAKLGDFGLAWLTTAADERTRLTSTNVTLGSPHYMAPEQLSGEAVDFRADIYSLGATAFHLLSGLPPLSGIELTRLLSLKLQGKSESLRTTRPDISPTSAELVDRLMAYDPKKRPQDYGTLIDEIDELIGQQSLTGSRRILASTQISTVPITSKPDPNRTTRQSVRPVDHDSPTLEIPAAHPRFSRRWWYAAIAVVVMLAASGAAAIRYFNLPGAPDLVPGGMFSELSFEGSSYQEWKRPFGSLWVPARNKDGEEVLEGDGTVVRNFSDLAKATPGGLQNYRLEMVVELHDASAIEVHFDFPPKDDSGRPASKENRRVVLRVSREGSQLGTKTGDQQGWHPLSPLVKLNKTRNNKHELSLERHTHGWYAFVDDKIVGFAFAREGRDEHEFRLITEDGSAWFSDFFVLELRKPSDNSPPSSNK
ncbi:Serine/threonine-protein kinase PrkC [Anatilimnocola aggregata]|uniref:Serine/threonine-protein kinase PrkC n=1 Tax=Anatilimnocola aggregata TaxID=2528021 RepID=A0A517YMJ6_9BACT|nr:serine/threonine-protein kinase [Anatilimnocola aggregata]QDU31445.1 Serine/threonine-protein kinase PrkC [Anatilimnocola aggregata]